MTRKVPIVATLVVALAVATMVALGFWQLRRLGEKEALLERYATAAAEDGSIPLPTTPEERLANLYRPATAICGRVTGQSVVGGHNRMGEVGWVQLARCSDPDGVPFEVAFGWTIRPDTVPFEGGPVNGRIGLAPGGTRLVDGGMREGVMMAAPPNPRTIPNNHLSYAIQWFLFAITAVVIYVLAVRKRWRSTPA